DVVLIEERREVLVLERGRDLRGVALAAGEGSGDAAVLVDHRRLHVVRPDLREELGVRERRPGRAADREEQEEQREEEADHDGPVPPGGAGRWCRSSLL